MKRRSLFAALAAAVPALAASLHPRISRKVGPFIHTIYTVTDPAAFLNLTFPAGMLFWNGVFLLPGIQYDVTPTGCKLRNLPLVAGETITVVTT